MTYGEWVLQCLGMWDNGNYLDQLATDFEQSDTLENENDMLYEIAVCMQCDRKALGNQIASRIFENTIQRAVDELDMHEEDFDYYCNGALDTTMTCKGEYVTSWADIEQLAEEKTDN